MWAIEFPPFDTARMQRASHSNESDQITLRLVIISQQIEMIYSKLIKD